MAESTLRADELTVEMQGGIRVSILTDGGRRLLHPSGVECIETSADITRRITDAQSRVTEAQTQLTAAQAVQAAITAAVEAQD